VTTETVIAKANGQDIAVMDADMGVKLGSSRAYAGHRRAGVGPARPDRLEQVRDRPLQQLAGHALCVPLFVATGCGGAAAPLARSASPPPSASAPARPAASSTAGAYIPPGVRRGHRRGGRRRVRRVDDQVLGRHGQLPTSALRDGHVLRLRWQRPRRVWTVCASAVGPGSGLLRARPGQGV
jgi:hypothetical protein